MESPINCIDPVNNDVIDPVCVTQSVCLELSIVTYNMHGYNQGYQTVRDLACDVKPDVFLLQEHWLSPSNLCKFEQTFFEYICAGSSAMSSVVESGVLRGRPCGGLMILVNKKHQKYMKVVCAAERYVVVVVAELLVIDIPPLLWH